MLLISGTLVAYGSVGPTITESQFKDLLSTGRIVSKRLRLSLDKGNKVLYLEHKNGKAGAKNNVCKNTINISNSDFGKSPYREDFYQPIEIRNGFLLIDGNVLSRSGEKLGGVSQYAKKILLDNAISKFQSSWILFLKSWMKDSENAVDRATVQLYKNPKLDFIELATDEMSELVKNKLNFDFDIFPEFPVIFHCSDKPLSLSDFTAIVKELFYQVKVIVESSLETGSSVKGKESDI